MPRELFDRVQRRLAELRPPMMVGTRAMQDAPFVGLLFDETGTAMLPTNTVKGQSCRYRYYVSRPAIKDGPSTAAISRIPAPPLEGLLSRVLQWMDLPTNEPRAAIHRIDIRANDIVVHLKQAHAIAVWRSAGLGARSQTDRQILDDRRELLESGETLVEDNNYLILSLPVRARFRGGAGLNC